MPWRREGTCADCGECCGTSGNSPFPLLGWESIRRWSLDDINLSYPMYTMFGLALIGEDEIGIAEPVGSVRIQGRLYYYVWANPSGKGAQPLKDTSIAHDGSSYSNECPFLKDDPGDGTRPCGLKGTNEDAPRKRYCRFEENPEYVPENDIWTDRAKEEWENDHPSCSYTWVEVT